MLAAPGDPGNGVALGDAQTPTRIDIAYGGSCTAGKRADFDYYHDVLSWAAGHGLKVADGVKLYLQFGTTDVLIVLPVCNINPRYVAERNLQSLFLANAYIAVAAIGMSASSLLVVGNSLRLGRGTGT